MSTTKYTLVPRGPVRGIGDNVTITEKSEIELNDFQALKVLLQGHALYKGSKMDEVVKISDFVEDVDPQAIQEKVNLTPDYTAGCKRENVSYTKITGTPRDFAPSTSEVDKQGKVDGQEAATATPTPVSESTSTSESTSNSKSDKTSESASNKAAETNAAGASKSASESANTASASSETAKN